MFKFSFNFWLMSLSQDVQNIMKVDMATKCVITWSAAPDGFVMEPVFRAAPEARSEDDGSYIS